MRPAHRAWAGLAAGVALWDLLCPKGETLTAGMAEWKQRAPAVVTAVVVVTAGHLLGVWPERADPYQWVALARGCVR
ncbi:hypothetical protein B5566_02375 [Mycobacterium sp. MHSD3]|nr:hypothetical protein B5566_02375 [Mycobacterium sp. MHSD3]